MKSITLIIVAYCIVCLSFCKSENKTDFKNGSGITSIQLTAEKTEDLVVLGKVWGYLKYYHPSVRSGKYNWDYELFKVMPLIIESKDKSERNKVLLNWIDTLGTPLKKEAQKVDSNVLKLSGALEEDTVSGAVGLSAKAGEVKLKPDLLWINDTQSLGQELSTELNTIKNTKREGSSHYVSLEPNVGNPLFDNEEAYKDFKYPDAGYRLLSLYRYWNIIQYYFPYKYLIEENWNTILPEYIPKFINANNDLEYKLNVLSLLTHVHDSHAQILNPDSTIINYHGRNFAPVSMAFVDGKAIIKKFWTNEVREKSGLKTGDVIISWDGKKTDDVVKERLPYAPGSNYSSQLRDLAWQDLLTTNSDSLSVTYEREGVIGTTTVKCFPPDKMPMDAEAQKKDSCFRTVANNIVRIFPGTIKNEYFPKVMPEILKSKGIIIDMRCYPSDFIVFTLSAYLMPQPKDFASFTKGSVTMPGLFTFNDKVAVGENNPQYYKGKVVIIVNQHTQSQAEFTSMAFRVSPNAIVIGNTTAGADGNASYFSLPGGINTMITGIGVYYPDGKETQRVGIVPDIEVKPTIKGIREGRDELLEKAIDIINGK